MNYMQLKKDGTAHILRPIVVDKLQLALDEKLAPPQDTRAFCLPSSRLATSYPPLAIVCSSFHYPLASLTHHCEYFYSHHGKTCLSTRDEMTGMSWTSVTKWLLDHVILILTFSYNGPLHDWTVDPMKRIAEEHEQGLKDIRPLLKKFKELKEAEGSFIRKAVRNFSEHEPPHSY